MSITARKLYEDGFYRVFESGATEFTDLKDLTKQMEADTKWTVVEGCRFEAIADPMDVEIICTDPANPGFAIPKEVLLDTADPNHAQLCVHFRNEHGAEVMECIGESGMPSIIGNITGVKGDGWNKPSPINKAIALNAFVPTAGPITVMTEHNKVRAMVSPKFQHMPIPELLQITEDLDAYLGTPEFQSGLVDHCVTVCKFLYKDIAKDITDAYRNILALHGRTLGPNEQVIPVVEFRTSNTTGEAAKLLTYLQLSPGHLMPVGEGIRVNHVAPVDYDENGNRKTALQKFREESQLIYSRLEFEMNDMLPAMLNTVIEYPVNTFIGLCKKAQIPQKWGGLVEEDLKADWPDHSGCTFLDIYEALTSVTKKALDETKNPNAARLLDLEEAIARIAHNRVLWTKYDLPGTVAWVQAVSRGNNN